jgi:hypothetical protein
MFRVPGTLYRNLGDGALDLTDIVGAKRDVGGGMFSSRRLSLVVPGIGTIHGFQARSHATDRAGVAIFFSANCLRSSTGPGSPCELRREARNNVAEVGAVEWWSR